MKTSVTFRWVFSRISLAWALFFLLRSGARLLTLAWSRVDVYVVVNLLTGVPLTLALMSWSIWYSVRRFKRSEEWGGFLRD